MRAQAARFALWDLVLAQAACLAQQIATAIAWTCSRMTETAAPAAMCAGQIPKVAKTAYASLARRLRWFAMAYAQISHGATIIAGLAGMRAPPAHLRFAGMVCAPGVARREPHSAAPVVMICRPILITVARVAIGALPIRLDAKMASALALPVR